MSDLLVVENVSKRFGGLRAVSDCSFGIPEGELVGLIGPNGAGKSTMFNLISGLMDPDHGSIRLGGTELVGIGPEAVARLGLARGFQTPRAFTSLSPLENMLASAQSVGERLLPAILGTYRSDEAQLAEKGRKLLELVGLSDRIEDATDELSGGELRMLEVARLLMRDPQVLLLDEPTAGVDPRLQHRLTQLLRTLNAAGLTILIVEHNLRFLLDLVDRVAVMVKGTLLTVGTPVEVRTDPEVIEAYLGGGGHAT